MLGKAKSLIESLQSSWNASGSNADDFQMSLYAAIEDEYNSGDAKKGLLAKINVETNYDEKITKAKYIKTRVDSILSKKDQILHLIEILKSVEQELVKEKETLIQLPNSYNKLTPSEIDYKKAKELLEQECVSSKAQANNGDIELFMVCFLISFVATAFFYFEGDNEFFSSVWGWVFGFGSIIFLYLHSKKLSAVRMKQIEIENSYGSTVLLEKKASEIVKQRIEKHSIEAVKASQRVSELEFKSLDLQNKIKTLLS